MMLLNKEKHNCYYGETLCKEVLIWHLCKESPLSVEMGHSTSLLIILL